MLGVVIIVGDVCEIGYCCVYGVECVVDWYVGLVIVG